MLSFKLDTPAKMTSGNVRKERHGQDDGVLALDMDFEAEVSVENLAQMALGDELDWSFLYDQDGQVKNLGVKRLVFDREFEDHEISVGVSDRGFDFSEAHLKKFSAEPVFGNRIKLHFQAQVHPDEQEIGPVLEGLVNWCSVKVWCEERSEETEEAEE